jgi:hypothetical protein
MEGIAIVPVHKTGEKTECSNYRGISLPSTSYKIVSNPILSRLSRNMMKLLGIISVAIDIIDHLLIILLPFVRYWRRNGSTVRVHQLFVGFKKAYDSVRREVLYSGSHRVWRTHETS